VPDNIATEVVGKHQASTNFVDKFHEVAFASSLEPIIQRSDQST
jgi:hypothetical protein